MVFEHLLRAIVLRLTHVLIILIFVQPKVVGIIIVHFTDGLTDALSLVKRNFPTTQLIIGRARKPLPSELHFSLQRLGEGLEIH